MEENTTKDLVRRVGVFVDLTGMRFGKLSVIGKGRQLPREGRKFKPMVMWDCVCDCGEKRLLKTGHLKSGACKSCGCDAPRIGNKNGTWKGCGEFPGHHLCHIRHRAIQFNREFDLTAEFLWELYLKQERKCALSGLDIGFSTQKKGRSTASLDRIFSNYGYTKDNVWWVHKDINRMKNNFRVEQFHWYCSLVAEYKRPNESLSIPS